MNIISQIISWLANPKNRSLQIFIGIVILFLLLLRQCNVTKSLKVDLQNSKDEISRIENNHLAELDSITQTYSAETGILTAEISGYQLTVEELEGKYKNLFSDYIKEKNKKPITIVDIQYKIKELIVGVDIESTPLDSLGFGSFSFKDSLLFSPGNSRFLAGTLPYKVSLHNKSDSSLLNYTSQEFFANVFPGKGAFLLQQEMAVNTGLTKDTKTGEIKVWAKTSYPGVNFNVLQGATIEDDDETKNTLASLRKSWSIGFSFGTGLVYTGNKTSPGLFAGVGLNYAPKKLQFGK